MASPTNMTTPMYPADIEQLLLWQASQIPNFLTSPRSADGVIDEEFRCGYSSKRCDNIRTFKKGGGLHRFCEFHRCRANKNQWRVDHKRRLMRSQLKNASAGNRTPSKPATEGPVPVKQEVAPAKTVTADPTTTFEEPAPLSASDIEMLLAILFDEDNMDAQISSLVKIEPAKTRPSIELKKECIV
ncbi:hypothetical protein Poli38472_001868 [Pythium oligandrum]|uniref:Uncharacterized protein n=1 Tax=Pythium oligandrum TaxID=41045 RepID=A0A8K1CTL9_PYTOL|nr:hypothetical protein Poli38472_001868 [Pythium oligandrum]|eukprot:TMW69712.1 hypothetical protein Poli38472_001868 [Pythium oligandrum]